MKKRVNLPKDEMPHHNTTIEWWYFNGFLKGKKNYAFMTCLFKADRNKIGLNLLGWPLHEIYFSHSILYDLKSKKLTKEILPIVALSKDSFQRKEFFVDYFYPLRKSFENYEISRSSKNMRVKTKFFDLSLSSSNKIILENNGFIDLGNKSTYYYTFPKLEVKGYVGKDKVKGIAWYDKQWSSQGFMKDSWIWFSLFLPDNTQIVCFDYKGRKLASICNSRNKQSECVPVFKPLGIKWKSPRTNVVYDLSWEITIGKYKIKTKPFITDCEMNFGDISYWEGPVEISVNGKKSRGFMEYLPSALTPKTQIEKFKKIVANLEQELKIIKEDFA